MRMMNVTLNLLLNGHTLVEHFGPVHASVISSFIFFPYGAYLRWIRPVVAMICGSLTRTSALYAPMTPAK